MPELAELEKDPEYRNLIKNHLRKIPGPTKKEKYIIVDISKLRGISLDTVNDVLNVDTGYSCGEVNQYLRQHGYK